MPSDKHNLITAMAMGLIFALFNVASSQDVPFATAKLAICATRVMAWLRDLSKCSGICLNSTLLFVWNVT